MTKNHPLMNHGTKPTETDENALRRLLRLLAGRVARRLRQQDSPTGEVHSGVTKHSGQPSRQGRRTNAN
jgi:hypothetical protein